MVQTGGNVAAAIAREDPELVWSQRGHQIALDISRGLAFLHSHKVCHGEFRPSPLSTDSDNNEYLRVAHNADRKESCPFLQFLK